MEFYMELNTLVKIDDEDLLEPACDLDRIIGRREFELNFMNQVPHWNLLSLKGLKYFKNLAGNRVNKKMIKRWKEEQD